MPASMTLFAVLVIVFVAFSARAGRAYVSAPMVFMLAGFGFAGTAFQGLGGAGVKAVAEVTLALLLFHGAAELRTADLRAEAARVGRLLLVALPLTMVGTFLLVRWLLPSLDPWLAVVLAAALAPTDSALSAATVRDPAVPGRVRRLLNLESGLNDGLATPVVLFAIAAAAGTSGVTTTMPSAVGAGVLGIVLGALVGIAVGRALLGARRRSWADEHLVPLAVLVTPLLCYFGASVLGGNGFMAAFVAGSAFAGTHGPDHDAATTDLELTRLTSALLGCAAWMLFGAATAGHVAALVQWQTVVVAVASLTVLRMVPVAVSLAGAGLDRHAVVFVGWFGPRGLPCVVFALIADDALAGRPGAATTVATIATAVVLSVLAHGLTAPPLSAAYGARTTRTAGRSRGLTLDG